jgi:hypothetical protein
MTDRCDGLSTRRRDDYASTETSCEPSAEQAATADTFGQQETEREAEARRNAYFAAGTDEGGRSLHASSDPGALQTTSKYDQHDKNAQLIAYYTRMDRPLADDVAGNALVAAAGAAAIGGMRAAGSGPDAAGAAIAKAALDAAAKSLVGVVRNESLGLAFDASRLGVALPPVPGKGPSASAPTAPRAESAPAAVGRSSARGASEVVRERVQTDAPRIPEPLPPVPFRMKG